MKKCITLLPLLFHLCLTALGQNTVLHLHVANGTSLYGSLFMPSQPAQTAQAFVFNSSNTATQTFQLNQPAFVQLFCFNPKNYDRQHLHYLFYLSPGDDLQFNADTSAAGFVCTVSGKGANNNQPLLAAIERFGLEEYMGDTLPYRVITAINKAQAYRQAKLAEYIKLYKPTNAYITNWTKSLAYYACEAYYAFKEANKLSIGGVYQRHYAAWQKPMDSLFATVTLSNDGALAAFRYQQFIRSFLSREKENLETARWQHPAAFFNNWYKAGIAEGSKQFDADPKNAVQEKIINRYFTGKTAEYLYAVLLNDAITSSNPQNIAAIFARFKTKYPTSPYIAQFSPAVADIAEKEHRTLNSNMVFLPGNGKTLNTLGDVVAAMKGKTVLVDMWGTWCGPCREEIEKNSQAIRDHFAGTKLDYLYIANNDVDNEEKWKKLIAYFNMQGMHLLANQQLTDDIMAKVNGQGFPTVFIIKKDGSIELSKTAYPIQRDVLINQLEHDLTE